jgi:hypothetical protein
MNIGTYLKELELARPMRVRALSTAASLMKEVGATFIQTNHFVERFAQRHSSPIESVRNFELAVRVLKTKATEFPGKKVALKVKNHVFIFDCITPGIVKAVSFWYTELPAAEALKGRGEIQIELS